jgi:hypothetical protein
MATNIIIHSERLRGPIRTEGIQELHEEVWGGINARLEDFSRFFLATCIIKLS